MTEQIARGGNADILTQFTPKLVSARHEGYDFDRLKADALAGLTVAIVALPLSMAIAIASGATLAVRRVLLHEGIREPLVAFRNA